MKKDRGQDRPKQQLPAEVLGDVLGTIRGQFYADAPFKQWAQDQHFIKREFVLYLASWLNKRGVTLKPERYKKLLLDRLNEIKIHGNTGGVKYWPGYLKHVLQQHLKHHGEDLYAEAKALRTQLDHALRAIHTLKPTGPDPITLMAEARRDLLQSKKTRPSKKSPDQLSLL